MEKDALMSHGAVAVAHERLCVSADGSRVVVCKPCGRPAITNHVDKKYMCRTCGDSAEFGTCTVPKSYHLLTHYLLGAGIELKLDIKKDACIPDQATGGGSNQ